MIFISSNRELYSARGIGNDKIALKHVRQGSVLESPEWDHSEMESVVSSQKRVRELFRVAHYSK